MVKLKRKTLQRKNKIIKIRDKIEGRKHILYSLYMLTFMEILTQLLHNKFMWVPFFTWLGIQCFKVIWDLIATKKFNFKRIMGAGGMPSSHSAIVMAITVMIGKEVGFDGWQFAVSLVFSCVVMYDAAGVRRAAGKQATLLNKIIETPGLTGMQVQEKLVEVLGHTPLQVVVGAIIGIIVGSIF